MVVACLLRIMTLPFGDVRRLDESVSTHLRRGDSVLAVFPETTSLYVVAKTPKIPNGSGEGDRRLCGKPRNYHQSECKMVVS